MINAARLGYRVYRSATSARNAWQAASWEERTRASTDFADHIYQGYQAYKRFKGEDGEEKIIPPKKDSKTPYINKKIINKKMKYRRAGRRYARRPITRRRRAIRRRRASRVRPDGMYKEKITIVHTVNSAQDSVNINQFQQPFTCLWYPVDSATSLHPNCVTFSD